MSEPLLRVEHLGKRYDGPAGAVEVLRDVNLDVAAGASVAITGPSGSGKSTLLNLIGTLDRPTQGHVWIRGADVNVGTEKETAAIRNASIGFVFQSHHLLPQLNVLENVLMPTLVNPAAAARGGEYAEHLLARVGLAHRLTHRPGELSGGERQRVAVVRALINRPALVLADEPTGSLDHTNADSLMELLAALNREAGTALIVVTHADSLAARMDRVFTLTDGVLVLVAGVHVSAAE